MNDANGGYVLLIEDDPWLAESYAALFSEGPHVEIVSSAHDAIVKCDEMLPKVILADVMLEYGLVLDFLHELQSHADIAAIPVILCTSLASQFDEKELRAYGVVKVLDKAKVTPDQLRSAVQEYI